MSDTATDHSTNRTRLNELNNLIEIFIKFLEPYKQLLNTHNVEFLTENNWHHDSYINKNIRDDLENFLANFDSLESSSIDQTGTKRPNLLKYYAKLSNSQNIARANLDGLFVSVKQLHEVWNGQVLTDPARLFESSGDLAEFERRFEKKFDVLKKENRFMNQKKSYEVDLMSKFVAKLCKKLDINTVSRFYYYLSFQFVAKSLLFGENLRVKRKKLLFRLNGLILDIIFTLIIRNILILLILLIF